MPRAVGPGFNNSELQPFTLDPHALQGNSLISGFALVRPAWLISIITMKMCALLLLGFVSACQAAQPPSTNFLQVVRHYADAMIEHGRDTYGLQKSGLLLSALDRTTLAPLKVRPAPPGGIRRGDRPGRPWSAMNGANPMLDQNLLRVFYTLSEITG